MFLHTVFKGLFLLHTALFRRSCMGGWYHYPRRALHVVETLDARGPRWRICRFYAVPEFALCGLNLPSSGTHATPAPNRAHSGSRGETGGLLSIGHSKALCCQRNCHRKNSRRKWMHALWRVSAFFGAAAPLGCAAWTLLFPQPRAFQPCCVCAYSFITGPCRCSGSSRNCCA